MIDRTGQVWKTVGYSGHIDLFLIIGSAYQDEFHANTMTWQHGTVCLNDNEYYGEGFVTENINEPMNDDNLVWARVV